MSTIPTQTEIKDQIITDIESETSKTAPSLPVSVWNIMATAWSAPFRLAYKYVQWAYRQIFVATADRDALVLKAAEFGIFPTPARKWIGEMDFTGTNGSSISSGAVLTRGSVVYRTTEGGTISGGTVQLEVESVATGASNQLEIGETAAFTSPVAGVDREGTVASITQSAEDSESTEALRTRVQLRQRLQPQGGSAADWILWTLDASGIGEAFASRPSPGFVNVYPLTNDSDPANRIPDSSKLTEVEDYLQALPERPLNSNVSAVAFTEIEFDITISNLFPDTAALRSAITSQVTAYLYARRPKQFLDEPDPIDIISASDIATIGNQAGASALSVDLRIQPADTSIVSYTLQAGELAVAGTIDYA